MNNITIETYSPDEHDLDKLLKQTKGKDVQMLPVTQDMIYERLEKNLPTLVAVIGREVVGMVGVTGTYCKNNKTTMEVGSLLVDKKHRGKGIGPRLVKELTSELSYINPGAILVAFCNQFSAKIFENAGYVASIGCVTLPEGLFELCKKCPKFVKVNQCCDEIYTMVPPYETGVTLS